MLSPLSLDLAAQDIVRERLQQAARAALVNQLRASASDARHASVSEVGFGWARALSVALGPRKRLADGLRALACRLDPAMACCDPPLAVLKVR